MNAFFAALWAEALKARRSKVSWLTALAFSIFPIVGGLFMMIMKDPDQARAMGLVGAKAQLLTGQADWPTYFDFLSMGTAVGGAMLFAFILAWVFGREFSDHTVKELLALPTRRETIVSAKFVLTAVWILGLTLWIFIVGLGIGAAIDIPGWSVELAWTSFWSLVVTALLTLMLMPVVAWVASAGRGYMPPLAWAFLTLGLAQIAGLLGWGSWFPWAVPGLFSMMFSVVYGSRAEPVGMHSFMMVGLVFIAGLAATYAWWRSADQAR
ncbi:MAG: ABC transporter permease [Thermoflexales bacterium]|nr:ABC transporter permease [Thermoflexales bacterium]